MHTKRISLRHSESKRGKELESREVQGKLGNRDDEQMAGRRADASGGDITENLHDENRMRDIHVGKRGSEAASEEQPVNLK